MKSAVVFLVFGVVAGAYAGVYGPPAVETNTPQVYRHVYVHSAPDEPVETQRKVIRVPGGDKHVNIIFVRTPSQSFNQDTEVILPEQDEQKNLVYVLLKKNEATSNVRIRGPAPTQPAKPEVYFIRYKDEKPSSDYGVPSGISEADIPVAAPQPVRSSQPSTSYGAPY